MASMILLMGPTGSGKSTQGDIASSARGWTHISSGALLRQTDADNSSVKSGDLASARTIEDLLRIELLKAHPQDVIVLDGFPRTNTQASWLDGFNQDHGNRIAHVIVLDISKDTSRTRLDERKRSDDGIAAFEEKWIVYSNHTLSVIQDYSSLGLVTTIPADGTIEDVTARINKVLSR